MGKLVILKLEAGSFEEGFPATLRIGDENARATVEITGKLPPEPEIQLYYYRWQSIYRNLDLSSRPIGLPKKQKQAPTLEECQQVAEELKVRFNTWLQCELFRPIREKWLEKLNSSEKIRIILQTKDLRLQKLPWHLWELLEHYPYAEIALSTPAYEEVTYLAAPRDKVKILAILGNSQGIDTQADRKLLEQLGNADITFLVEPECKDLTDQLWEQPWQILFFAGHSFSQESGETGKIYINQTESLTISQLKYALKKAVERGLQLAIFNSCDGLGLAREFSELQIPQMVVMREPVPDKVAQEFLKYFLAAFSRGESLYLAVKEARERLQGLENQFPCATWLPVICQNPAEEPPTWQELSGSVQGEAIAFAPLVIQSIAKIIPPSGVKYRWGLLMSFLVSVAVTVLVMGVRYGGMLQSLELEGFDQMLRLRPQEEPDPRLLVITVTEDDVEAQPPEQRRGSLSDESLLRVLEKLKVYQPQVIGLDIYRDYEVGKDNLALAKLMQQSDSLIGICRVSDPQVGKVGVAPPPKVPLESLGFSDIVLDSDNIVRRHLLALKPPPSSPCLAKYAFNVQIALRYLATKNIFVQFTKEGFWQLGTTIIKPITPHTGGYQGIDAWGHQIFLNYRSYSSPREIAPQITLKQVLAGQLEADAVKDKIVLIGTTAESFRDYSLTPYTTHSSNSLEIPGVMLQAQMISQLLSAVLDGRPLLWTWCIWQETIWIWAWSLLGSLLAWYLRRPSYFFWGIIVAIACLYVICCLILMQLSGWLPLIPSALALVSSSGSVVVYKISLTKKVTEG